MEGLEERVEIKVKDSIARISFFSNKSNSLSVNLIQKVITELKKQSSDDSCRTIIIESQGDGVFCAGASLTELESCKTKEAAEAIFHGFADLINCMRKTGKFVICKVQGKALGGAVGIIASSDYVLALDTALVKLPELSVGIGPYAISASVERKVGLSAFSEMSIDCEWKDAKWCLQKGLFNKLFATHIELEEAVLDFAKHLSKLDKSASTELRKLIWQGTENWDQLLKERAGISAALLMKKKHN
ncbi:MAG: enoyl-CoA hydratase/isomerase family protein [Proteobacteria bacterium]|nr:enoyl-CoA hydratase/isomerase family protein [Pseudomonadota bacterium]